MTGGIGGDGATPIPFPLIGRVCLVVGEHEERMARCGVSAEPGHAEHPGRLDQGPARRSGRADAVRVVGCPRPGQPFRRHGPVVGRHHRWRWRDRRRRLRGRGLRRRVRGEHPDRGRGVRRPRAPWSGRSGCRSASSREPSCSGWRPWSSSPMAGIWPAPSGIPTDLDPALAAGLLGQARLAVTDAFRGPDGQALFGPAVAGSRRCGAGRPARRLPRPLGVTGAR